MGENDHDGRMVGATRRIFVRPLVPSDLPWLYELMLLPATSARLRFQGGTPSYDDFCRHAWDTVLGQWVVIGRTTGRRLGLVVVASPDHRNGYAFLSTAASQPAIGTGMVFEGAGLVIRHVFETWPFRMLYSEVTEAAYAQFRSLGKRLFEVEGIRRAQVFFDGHYQDVHLLTLTRERWNSNGLPLLRRLEAAGRSTDAGR